MMPGVVAYREAPAGPDGAVVWSARHGTGELILPDACLDLIWTADRLIVAGPDTRARWHDGGGAAVGLRLPSGLGPALLGTPADELRDRVVDLADLWGARRARALTERVAGDPVAALSGVGTAAPGRDPFAAGVLAGASRGRPAAALADDLGCTVRTLHRRCLASFGYGPQHLARVTRLQRALAAVRHGHPWADAAALAGYADQPHLVRDVRALAGTTPTALARQRGYLDAAV